MSRRRLPVATLATALAVGLATLLLAATGAGGWPGEANGCRETMRPACFCERLRPAGLAQPANTLSNLGFVAVGLAIALAHDGARRRGRPPHPRNPMTAGDFHPTVFAVVTALLGPGSMALHASMTVWGGRLDVLSMYLFIGLVCVYALSRLRPLSHGAFLAIYAAVVGALAWTKWSVPVNSDLVFGAMIGVALALNVAVARRRPELRLDRRWVWSAAGLFALAFAIWLPSRSGGALCAPDSPLQGHALWHLLCAGAAGCVYLYLRSERRAPAGPAGSTA